MNHYPTIAVTLNTGILFNLDYLDLIDWNGIICQKCSTNIVTMAFGVEIFLPTNFATQTLFAQYDFCIECDDFPSVVAFQAARKITEMYNVAS